MATRKHRSATVTDGKVDRCFFNESREMQAKGTSSRQGSRAGALALLLITSLYSGFVGAHGRE
jgi:hypothetical protein